MKTFVSALTLGLIVAFSAPAFAASDASKKTEQSQSKTAKQPEKTAKQQEKKPMY